MRGIRALSTQLLITKEGLGSTMRMVDVSEAFTHQMKSGVETFEVAQ
jgi:hypothetical protein